jgi:hypothetical protein
MHLRLPLSLFRLLSGSNDACLALRLDRAKLNGHNPEAFIREVLERIADHPINRINEPLPWNLRRPTQLHSPATAGRPNLYDPCRLVARGACRRQDGPGLTLTVRTTISICRMCRQRRHLRPGVLVRRSRHDPAVHGARIDVCLRRPSKQNALRFKRPTWVYVDGELRSGFALNINDAESFLLFGRVEPAIDGNVSVERYAKPPSQQPAPQAAETIAP